MKVFVYRNLNRRGWVWSIKAVDGPNKGLVIGYASGILISNPTFRVSEAGRQRVLKQLRKNVHAGIVGELINTHGFTPRNNYAAALHVPKCDTAGISWLRQHDDCDDITYNPYKYKTFVKRSDTSPVMNARYASIWFNEVKADI